MNLDRTDALIIGLAAWVNCKDQVMLVVGFVPDPFWAAVATLGVTFSVAYSTLVLNRLRSLGMPTPRQQAVRIR